MDNIGAKGEWINIASGVKLVLASSLTVFKYFSYALGLFILTLNMVILVGDNLIYGDTEGSLDLCVGFLHFCYSQTGLFQGMSFSFG